ncbi:MULTISPECIES: serine/threonine-protein kinase [unclassified Tolypothrix]|uniref:serine/threonine-protein kinase n=1 Tax=unclassified Tolypothrix TaxID=2649714 RepID=UPI0005EAB9EA|nr:MULTISPECIES: serine/threonine-protein kinase [unclassified Tolypothrix]BAY93495.1 response regulator receiver modulated translation initiation factor IF-2 [Microchaete diplosiphon NIES-3275]EKE99439.1 serine/threonine protein kinase [Tolypothrix sp. PCC 7601]MBE9080800.1 serine/threonine protein kinase [Tolypothrix sp. LEGE 11397]UYD27333.1 serine/threonine protein kinase [Tolypothrix sp. PCC 7712]UYD36805.1 serine/threonine protein kinase [Tolypothrix sp. PCC 7601]
MSKINPKVANRRNKSKEEIANERIEYFVQRFSKEHLYLAYHAAFPLSLTPELLYLLWARFQKSIHGEVLNIPWIAVGDILLSNLCDEVGHELYEMDLAVRTSLLKRLQEDENFGQQRINELSGFLLDYIRQKLQSDDPDIQAFAQIQRWVALAYTKPSQVAHELALAFSKLDNQAERVRLQSLTETLAEPLAEFQPLLTSVLGMGHVARNDFKVVTASSEQLLKESVYPLHYPEPQHCLCINLNCPSPKRPFKEHPCQACGSDLLLNRRYRVIDTLVQTRNRVCRLYDSVDIKDGNKPKVIKVLYTDNDEIISRFDRGADVLINHWVSGIPKVDKDGYFYIEFPKNQTLAYCLVMEKIDGINLEQFLENQNHLPITEKQAINWLKQLTIILRDLDEKEFFHRDIKPSNIMVKNSNQELVLIDIDAVRAITKAVLDGKTIATIGSDGYMAPEQRIGRAIPQSDFYALGRTFVHLLTGKAPNRLEQNRNGTLLWRSIAPKLSKPFADLIDSLMDWSPNNRPKNTAEILQRLEQIERNLERQQQVKQLLIFNKVVGVVVLLSFTFLVYKSINPEVSPIIAPTPSIQTLTPTTTPTETPIETPTFNTNNQKCRIRQFTNLLDNSALAKDVVEILQDKRVVSKDEEIRKIQQFDVRQLNYCDLNIYIRLSDNSIPSSTLKNKIADMIKNRFDYVGNIKVEQLL